MARTKKKTKSSARAKAKPARRAKPQPKKAAAKARTKATAKPKSAAKRAGKENDVERHWRDYRQCRSELEKAVASVRQAEQTLTAARELERGRREVFDRTKEALKGLLEVEPASGTSSPSTVLDFPSSDGIDFGPDDRSSIK